MIFNFLFPSAMDLADTTTGNYATIAKLDDHKREAEAGSDAIPKADRATSREQRIAAAVERSKTEYKREHVFTERGVREAQGDTC